MGFRTNFNCEDNQSHLACHYPDALYQYSVHNCFVPVSRCGCCLSSPAICTVAIVIEHQVTATHASTPLNRDSLRKPRSYYKPSTGTYIFSSRRNQKNKNKKQKQKQDLDLGIRLLFQVSGDLNCLLFACGSQLSRLLVLKHVGFLSSAGVSCINTSFLLL